MKTGLLLTLITLIICGCGGGQPTATPEMPTLISENTTPEVGITESSNLLTSIPDTTQEPPPTARPTFVGELVPGEPRTLVASRTEDPDANIPFTRIRLERTGGPFTGATPEPLVIEIGGDGKITRNSATEGQLQQGTLDTLNAMLREMNFFGISGDYLGVVPLEGSEDYFYAVTVERGDLSRTINAKDGTMPQELKNVIAMVLQEGSRI